jgi:hypothetical protein
VLGVEVLGDAEHAAPGIDRAGAAGAADDILAHDDDRRVAVHFEIERLVDGLFDADLAGHSGFLRGVRVGLLRLNS